MPGGKKEELKNMERKEILQQREAITQKIKSDGEGAPERWMTLAASAMAGNAAAMAEIESSFGIKVKSMLDLYNVTSAAASLMSKSELAKLGNESAQKLEAPADPEHEADAYLANRLKELRTAAGMTQNQLAQAAGLALSVVQKYENGVNRLLGARTENVLRIARALGVSVDDLVG